MKITSPALPTDTSNVHIHMTGIPGAHLQRMTSQTSPISFGGHQCFCCPQGHLLTLATGCMMGQTRPRHAHRQHIRNLCRHLTCTCLSKHDKGQYANTRLGCRLPDKEEQESASQHQTFGQHLTECFQVHAMVLSTFEDHATLVRQCALVDLL